MSEPTPTVEEIEAERDRFKYLWELEAARAKKAESESFLRGVRVANLEGALRYIAAPTCGFPGVMASTPAGEVDAFIRNNASESNVRAALATCVGAARALLAPVPSEGEAKKP